MGKRYLSLRLESVIKLFVTMSAGYDVRKSIGIPGDTTIKILDYVTHNACADPPQAYVVLESSSWDDCRKAEITCHTSDDRLYFGFTTLDPVKPIVGWETRDADLNGLMQKALGDVPATDEDTT
jgi:hypothetical protein